MQFVCSDNDWLQKMHKLEFDDLDADEENKMIDSNETDLNSNKLNSSTQISVSGGLSEVHNYALLIKTRKFKKTRQVNINWEWNWDKFAKETEVKREKNKQLWYDSNIIDDKNNYRKFVNKVKEQKLMTLLYKKEEIREKVDDEKI